MRWGKPSGRRWLRQMPCSSDLKKVTAGLFVSLDGVTESPEKWQLPYFNDEMGEAVGAAMAAADAMLLRSEESNRRVVRVAGRRYGIAGKVATPVFQR